MKQHETKPNEIQSHTLSCVCATHAIFNQKQRATDSEKSERERNVVDDGEIQAKMSKRESVVKENKEEKKNR